MDDKIFNDYVFHECGGQTWLNAKITIKTDKQVKCQESLLVYTGQYLSQVISMKAIDVDSWSERDDSRWKDSMSLAACCRYT